MSGYSADMAREVCFLKTKAPAVWRQTSSTDRPAARFKACWVPRDGKCFGCWGTVYAEWLPPAEASTGSSRRAGPNVLPRPTGRVSRKASSPKPCLGTKGWLGFLLSVGGFAKGEGRKELCEGTRDPRCQALGCSSEYTSARA